MIIERRGKSLLALSSFLQQMVQMNSSPRTAQGYQRRQLIGAQPVGNNQWFFRVWAPNHTQVEIEFEHSSPKVSFDKVSNGYWEATVGDTSPGSLYFFVLDGETRRPDPASRSQPQGVHGPSAVVDLHFNWSDSAWTGLPLSKYVLYEMHVGTFTPEGTFAAAIPHLDHLAELGITAIELMPVAQ
jgi:maltooligosyltrehalose trehalohydrolase